MTVAVQATDPRLDSASLARIAGASAPLHDRLAHPEWFRPGEGDAQATWRFERWSEACARGNSAAFDRILAFRGLDRDSARRFLGDPVWNTAFPLPSWTKLLAESIERNGDDGDLLIADQPWPFEELTAPFVLTSRDKIREHTAEAYDSVSKSVHHNAERTLLYWLCNMCSPALGLELSIFRLKKRGLNAARVYREFIDFMFGEGMPRFLTEYCVLARVLAIVVEHWIESYSELLIRLSADREILEQIFCPSTFLGDVVDIQTGVSDPHNGGRTVAAILFSSGTRVMYKPKCLGLDEEYSALIDWIEAREAAFDLRPARTLNRGHYGWVEFIQKAHCFTESERRDFYRRAGMLVCLLYILESTDAHNENVIAHGDQPVLVDLETLLNPRLADFEAAGFDEYSEIAAQRRMSVSVLRTRMLPWWRGVDSGKPYDASALGGLGGEETAQLVWRDVKTANYRREMVTARVEQGRSAPGLGVSSADLLRAVEPVTAGFREMYNWLRANRDALNAAGGPFDRLARHEVRFIFRDTDIYFKLLKGSFEPDLLRNGADRSIHLEALCWLLAASESRERYAPIVAAEIKALEDGDIPYFSVPADGRALFASASSVAPDLFSKSIRQRLTSNLAGMSQEDREQQVEIIRGSFYSRCAVPPDSRRPLAPDARPPHPLNTADLTAGAIEIGREIAKRAIRGSDGSASWISLCWNSRASVYQYQPTGISLSDGAPGISLFLAALESVGTSGEFRALALQALAPVRRILQGYEAARKRSHRTAILGLGGLEGFGSTIWGCARVGALLGDEGPIQIAIQCARLIDRAEFQTEKRADVAGGLAGAVLGLTSLYRLTRQGQWLDLAVAGGNRLRSEHAMSGGFANGAAGIEYALRSLAEATGDRQYWSVNDRCQTAEADDPTWYSGAAGTGLLGLVRADSEVTVDRPLTSLPLAVDSYAYGTAGVLDFLVETARRKQRSDLTAAAQRWAAYLIARPHESGGYRLFSGLPSDAYSPGLLEGTAGIGYVLLRIANPSALPPLLIED